MWNTEIKWIRRHWDMVSLITLLLVVIYIYVSGTVLHEPFDLFEGGTVVNVETGHMNQNTGVYKPNPPPPNPPPSTNSQDIFEGGTVVNVEKGMINPNTGVISNIETVYEPPSPGLVAPLGGGVNESDTDTDQDSPSPVEEKKKNFLEEESLIEGIANWIIGLVVCGSMSLCMLIVLLVVVTM